MEHPLTQYRRSRNLSQEAFGRLVGAVKSMVSKWEQCRAFPSSAHLEAIEDATSREVTASDLSRHFNKSSRGKVTLG